MISQRPVDEAGTTENSKVPAAASGSRAAPHLPFKRQPPPPKEDLHISSHHLPGSAKTPHAIGIKHLGCGRSVGQSQHDTTGPCMTSEPLASVHTTGSLPAPTWARRPGLGEPCSRQRVGGGIQHELQPAVRRANRLVGTPCRQPLTRHAQLISHNRDLCLWVSLVAVYMYCTRWKQKHWWRQSEQYGQVVECINIFI